MYYTFSTENPVRLYLWEKASLQGIFPGDASIRYEQVLFVKLVRSGHCYAKLPTTMKLVLNTKYRNINMNKQKTQPVKKARTRVIAQTFFLKRSEKYT